MGLSIQSAPLRIALTGREEATLTFDQRKALAIANCTVNAKPTCDKILKVGIFLTVNNNRQRDKLDHLGDRTKQYHSNIVSLFEAHKDVRGKGSIQGDDCYRVYVPGVGTRFEEGCEYRESTEGKAMAKGGQARILFAVLHVYNVIHRAFNNNDAMLNGKQIIYEIKNIFLMLTTIMMSNDITVPAGLLS